MTPVLPTNPVGSSLPDLFFTDEMDVSRLWPTIFMYAVAGAGKTNAIRTLVLPGIVTGKKALEFPPLVLATEDGQTKGMSTLADLHLPAILINSIDELVGVTSELKASSKPGEAWYRGKGPFGAIGCDSLTGVGPMLEDAVRKLYGWTMIWDATKGGAKDPRRAYPYINERARQAVRALMDLPVPLILTCREQILTEGEGASAKSYPAPELPGQKLPRELPGWPEATVRIRMLNGQRVMQTENEGDIVARVRLKEGMRLPALCRPDIGALLRILRGDATALDDLDLKKGVPAAAPYQKTPQQLAAEARRA